MFNENVLKADANHLQSLQNFVSSKSKASKIIKRLKIVKDTTGEQGWLLSLIIIIS